LTAKWSGEIGEWNEEVLWGEKVRRRLTSGMRRERVRDSGGGTGLRGKARSQEIALKASVAGYSTGAAKVQLTSSSPDA